ncbi:hypothetical protein TgHK011_001259 [Trichoderma gracile]|nr:hypothetical protein TgHK011_001259 [Trichoderma gracile]
MDSKPERLEQRPNVAFFHFSELNRTRLQSAESALRAVATQLVHNNRTDRISLDALAMIETDSGSGQSVASPKDVRTVIDILLRQHPTFIVLDGIDECDHPSRLLETVRGICLEHDCRFILLGRPNIAIPHQWNVYEGAYGALDLRPDFISDDLKAYLGDHLENMAFRGLFGEAIESSGDLVRHTRPGLLEELADEIELKVSNLSDVHFSMAQTCLSYLVFDVPSKPLTKEDATPSRWDLEASSNTILATHEDELRLRTKSEEEQLRRSYPLLPYSALCWDYHVAHAHELRGLGTVAPFPLERPPLWYTLLSQFLLDRLSVTAWVEASYAFKVPPRLSRLPPALVYLRPQPTDMAMTVQTREYQWTYLGLQQLVQALNYLQKSSGSVLLRRPRMIWSEEIAMAVDEDFWPNWEEETPIRVPGPRRDATSDAGWRYTDDISAPPA